MSYYLKKGSREIGPLEAENIVALLQAGDPVGASRFGLAGHPCQPDGLKFQNELLPQKREPRDWSAGGGEHRCVVTGGRSGGGESFWSCWSSLPTRRSEVSE